jgi:hypothetical protein
VWKAALLDLEFGNSKPYLSMGAIFAIFAGFYY